MGQLGEESVPLGHKNCADIQRLKVSSERRKSPSYVRGLDYILVLIILL